jgi:hypothetical protein
MNSNTNDQQVPQQPPFQYNKDGLQANQTTARPVITPEERMVFQQCSKEAFWTRSLPLSLIMGGCVMMGARSGRIPVGEKYGHWPKTVGAVAFGYIFGKASYIEPCREKFLAQAPNSMIAQAIRRDRGLPELEPSEIPVVGAGKAQQDDYSYFATEEKEATDNDPNSRKPGMSYDALRDQHRQKLQPKTGYVPLNPAYDTPIDNNQDYIQNRAPPPLREGAPPRKRRDASNKYGDEGFE